MAAARAELESLLRARKLDTTLTSSCPNEDEARLAPTGWAALDSLLGGGLRRGHLSEVVGVRSSGRSALFCRLAAAATSRGEAVSLVDTHDRFDPGSAAAAGVDLARVLWVRDRGDAERALKAMMLVLQAGGFGMVALDLADVQGLALRHVPHATWMRFARVVEGSSTVALLLAAEHLARSPGGATILLEPPEAAGAGTWHGAAPRTRRFAGLPIRPRVIAPRAGAPLR